VLDYRASVTEETAAPLRHEADDGAFQVHLGEVFDGPFDLLLGLIAKHRLDVTEVALAKVTDDFIGHIRARGSEWDLGQATEFLVVAATLLDLKAARLLEARDLLFARLLQYRAYKEAAAVFARRMGEERGRHARAVTLEPHFAGLLPEVLLGIGPEQLAVLASQALTPRPVPTVSMDHLHATRVSVREQAAILVAALRRSRSSTFRALTADCDGAVYVVARFLALLELFREGAVMFDQVSPLGELHIRWTGTDDGDIGVTDEFDTQQTEAADDDQR
jgi:segregation and condensation protein A